MAQPWFEVGGFSIRCSELTSKPGVLEFKEMMANMEEDAVVAARLANSLKDFEPNTLGDIAADLSLAPSHIVTWLQTVEFEKKSSYFYTPVYTEKPFVAEAGIYLGIKASQEKTKELFREWSEANIEQFMTNNPGAVKSSVAPQWVYLLSMQNFENIDVAAIFPSEDQERIDKIIPQVIPDKYGVAYKVFAKTVVVEKQFSYDEMDVLVSSPSCKLDLDCLSQYQTFYKKTDEGKGWGIKHHALQAECPKAEGDVTTLNPLFNPAVNTMVIDIVLWRGTVTQGELCKVGFYYEADGTKVINIVPPFQQAKYAIKKEEWAQQESYDFDEMVIKEYSPCHFQSDSYTISKFLKAFG